jgi:shikimate dehydrogenase
VWNRHPDRARALSAELGGTPVDGAEPADLLINCTPAGMDGDPAAFKHLPLEADEISMFRCVVDLVYSHVDTPLIQAAKARGLPVVDGVDLLVGQGALSFERFTGRRAPLEEMRAAARRR